MRTHLVTTRKTIAQGLLTGLLLAWSAVALAAIELNQLSTPELSARYKKLIQEYRCPKCQNQNLAGSDSTISMDLRREIRRMLEEGKSDREISDYLVARYGEFVLYRPRLQRSTYLLWLGPALLLLTGAITVALVIRRQARTVSGDTPEVSGQAGLDASEEARLQDLLGEPGASGAESIGEAGGEDRSDSPR